MDFSDDLPMEPEYYSRRPIMCGEMDLPMEPE